MSTQPSSLRTPYQKSWLSCADQVAKLVSRGLTVADPAAAERFLSHVNYYRFSGYCLAYEQQRHTFTGCTFEQVRATYDFDMVLRDIVAVPAPPADENQRELFANRPRKGTIRPEQHEDVLARLDGAQVEQEIRREVRVAA